MGNSFDDWSSQIIRSASKTPCVMWVQFIEECFLTRSMTHRKGGLVDLHPSSAHLRTQRLLTLESYAC
ncbi:hypothetical protein NC651_036717 [Populus alba x Populus x berolinensis]|nr:hypothetical protein NC651_036717 [Populus alba x Populus x berolinensis]